MRVRHENRFWTKEDHEKLVSMIGKCSEKEMAQALNRTQGAICVRVKEIKQGETFKFYTPPVKPKKQKIELTLPSLKEFA